MGTLNYTTCMQGLYEESEVYDAMRGLDGGNYPPEIFVDPRV